MESENFAPYLIIGLGNPGRQYRQNRHNAGFMFLDRLAAHMDVRFSRLEHHALVVKTRYQDKTLILAKPQTYMNLSGRSVSALSNYYKVPLENLLAVYDDVDLPLGTIRIRPDGGSGGHKGMESIIEKLGSKNFARMRLGIGRPPGRMDAATYVLQNFSKQELEELEFLLPKAVNAALTFIMQGLEAAMNQFNMREDG